MTNVNASRHDSSQVLASLLVPDSRLNIADANLASKAKQALSATANVVGNANVNTPETEVDSTVVLSDAAKQKLAAEQEEVAVDEADLKSFAFGALGLDHPEKVEEKEDTSYTAGQYVKAAATIGSMIALFI
ncbi:hypothetical protein [Shewanella youngdeokensis]|uniref:Uncharacterized protein n=1 Tax=Shewanella youngdeokensis TaxID=2999068 RepID=A0ABZ0JW78_9GAMM|nr:hypothetical protein RGE70_14715 [Shewanella sp. DAU334]